MNDEAIPEDVKTNYAKSPADLRERAEMIAKNFGFSEALLAGAICSALVMERERCAKIADTAAKRSNRQGTVVALSIAKAIRSSS